MSDTIFSREDRKRIALLVDLLRDYELCWMGSLTDLRHSCPCWPSSKCVPEQS